MKNRPQGKPSDYVFPKRADKRKPESKELIKISHTFFQAVDELGLNNGIDDPRLQVCFHTCRHSYAGWLIEEGADLYTVQKLLGHKTNVMTQRYSHLSENRMQNDAKSLEKAFKQEKVNVVDFQETVEQGK